MRIRDLLAQTALLTTVIAAGGADAAFIPPPTGPIYIHFSDDEQFSASNAFPFSAVNATGSEGNWGIVEISDIERGTVLSPTGSDIQGGGSFLFTNGQNGGQQILGIFYGVHINSTSPTLSLASGGVLDLYGFNSSSQDVGTELASAANLAKRTAQNQYTGFTCAGGNTANCTFLAQFDFVYGSNGAGDTTDTIVTPTDPATSDGTAKSYLAVDTGVVGAWTAAFNDNFFTLDPNNAPLPDTPDVRLDNNFTHNGAGAWSVAGSNIVGLRSNDPARSFLVSPIPEPASLALLGTALLAGGAMARRRGRRRG